MNILSKLVSRVRGNNTGYYEGDVLYFNNGRGIVERGVVGTINKNNSRRSELLVNLDEDCWTLIHIDQICEPPNYPFMKELLEL